MLVVLIRGLVRSCPPLVILATATWPIQEWTGKVLQRANVLYLVYTRLHQCLVMVYTLAGKGTSEKPEVN